MIAVGFTAVANDQDAIRPAPLVRSLLRHLGLEPKEPGPDDWVKIIGCKVDGPTGSSAANGLVEQLASIGVTAKASPYKVPDGPGSDSIYGGVDAKDRILMAVYIQQRDLDRTREFLSAHRRGERQFAFPKPPSGATASNTADAELAVSQSAGSVPGTIGGDTSAGVVTANSPTDALDPVTRAELEYEREHPEESQHL